MCEGFARGEFMRGGELGRTLDEWKSCLMWLEVAGLTSW